MAGPVEAELDPAGGRAMAVSRSQPWSLIGLATWIPSAWRAATVAATSSVRRYSSARPPSSAGWTAISAGGRAKINQPPPASTDRVPSALAQGRPGRVGVVAIENGVSAVDYARLLAVAGPVVEDRAWLTIDLAALQDAADKGRLAACWRPSAITFTSRTPASSADPKNGLRRDQARHR
jgi:hypothetical protein